MNSLIVSIGALVGAIGALIGNVASMIPYTRHNLARLVFGIAAATLGAGLGIAFYGLFIF